MAIQKQSDGAMDMKFSEAMDELEGIVQEIEQRETSIDVIAEKIERALYLVEFCGDMIETIKTDVDTLLSTAPNLAGSGE